MSSIGGINGPPRNLFKCGCWCLFGLISIPAAIFAASVDCSWALLIIASFDLVIMSVGHSNPSLDIFLGMYNSLDGNGVILFDSFLKRF